MYEMIELTAKILCFTLFLYKWLIIVAVILTWFSADPYNPIVIWINRVTRPVWRWCESWLPRNLVHYSAYASILVAILAQAIVPATLRSINLYLQEMITPSSLALQIAGHSLQGMSTVTQSLLFFFVIILAIWFFLTLVNPAYHNPLVQIVYTLADPLITPLQHYLPRTRVDLSPIVGILFFLLINSYLLSPISHVGSGFSYPVQLCVY